MCPFRSEGNIVDYLPLKQQFSLGELDTEHFQHFTNRHLKLNKIINP